MTRPPPKPSSKPAPKREAVSEEESMLPPASYDSERGVLACCLLDPSACVSRCVAELKAGGEEFFDLRHKVIFEAMCELMDDNEPLDMITLRQKLKDSEMLAQVEGIGLLQLQDAVPSAANLMTYLEVIKEKYSLRKMLEACEKITASIYQANGDTTAVLDDAERMVLEVRSLRETSAELEPKQLVSKAIQNIEDMWQRKGALDGLSTGFPDWDKMTGGLHGGEFTVIAAYPGHGKTSLAMNVAEHVLVEQAKPVGIFSLEMTATALVTRMICSRARVNLRNVREGFVADRDFPKLTLSASKLAKSNMRFEDASDMTAYQFRAKARRMRQEHKIELAVLDYIQLLTAPGKKTDSSRQLEVSEISRVIKATARELGIPIIAMSQLNDDGQLRESRAIGQDADNVMILEPEDGEQEYYDAQPVALRIKKQRNGPTGKVMLTFLKGYTRFESAAKVSDEDAPNAVNNDY